MEKALEVNNISDLKLKKNKKIKNFIFSFCSWLIPLMLPPLQMFIYSILIRFKVFKIRDEINTHSCTCSCFDNFFKGPYESGVARYKHIYINATSSSFIIWTMTVTIIIVAYNTFNRLFKLFYYKNLRFSMAFMFLTSVHSHYYAWWATLNYINDHFVEYWYHQLFYTATEIISTAIVVQFMDKRKQIDPYLILVIANISLFHVFSSSYDQFFSHIFKNNGPFFQQSRDMMLMINDVSSTGFSLYEFNLYAKSENLSFFSALIQKKFLYLLTILTLSMYLYIVKLRVPTL